MHTVHYSNRAVMYSNKILVILMHARCLDENEIYLVMQLRSYIYVAIGSEINKLFMKNQLIFKVVRIGINLLLLL